MNYPARINPWILIIGIVVGITSPSLLIAQETRPTKHVVLISIDGFRPDFYLEEKWPSSNFLAPLSWAICAACFAVQ